MQRRDFLRHLSLSLPLMACGCSGLWHRHGVVASSNGNAEAKAASSLQANEAVPAEPKTLDDFANAKAQTPESAETLLNTPNSKVLYFDQDFPDDVYCNEAQKKMIQQLVAKFRGVQRSVGNGNFNLIGMDEFFRFGSKSANLTISREEKKYLEELFYFDATKYGFYGEKSFKSFTDAVNKSNVVKVPYTGHFLRKGKSLETYLKLKKDVGSSVILTSGVRSLAKQFHLFLEKSLISGGNLSKASRSLAPPGYSFHGQGDFDIGRVGYGLKNFTDDFAKTSEFKKLRDLGYVEIRYTESNKLGVRFEPWHIKISHG